MQRFSVQINYGAMHVRDSILLFFHYFVDERLFLLHGSNLIGGSCVACRASPTRVLLNYCQHRDLYIHAELRYQAFAEAISRFQQEASGPAATVRLGPRRIANVLACQGVAISPAD